MFAMPSTICQPRKRGSAGRRAGPRSRRSRSPAVCSPRARSCARCSSLARERHARERERRPAAASPRRPRRRSGSSRGCRRAAGRRARRCPRCTRVEIDVEPRRDAAAALARVVQRPHDAAQRHDPAEEQPRRDQRRDQQSRSRRRPRARARPAPRRAAKPAISAVANGTRRRPCARRAQNALDRFPNIGAAVTSASTAGCTWKSLSAITPMKPPSISAGPTVKQASVRRSRR